MDDDKTVIKPLRSLGNEPDSDRTLLFQPDTLSVSVLGTHGEIISTVSCTHQLTAGRALDNTLVIDSGLVSRHHLEVKWENGSW